MLASPAREPGACDTAMVETPDIPDRVWLVARLKRHVSELVRLAVPTAVARAGLLIMVLVDTVMVGRYATEALAYLAIGTAVIVPLLVTGVGLLIGTIATAANAFGRGEPAQSGAAWMRSLPYAAGLGLIGAAVSAFGTPILALSGQTPVVAEAGGRITWIVGLGLPFALLFTTTAFFLEGIKRPTPGMVVMIGANLLNALLNWLLIYGNAGFPELGAEGSAWTTTAVRAFMAAAIIAYALSMRGHARFAVRRWPGWRWRYWALQRRIGYGGGLSHAIESGAFTMLNLFAGRLGIAELAGFSIAFNLVALVFMIAIGFSSATAVRVGFAHGVGDARDLAMAGWTGLLVNSAAMAAFAAVFMLLPGTLASLYSNDPDLLATAGPLIVLAGLVLIPDGGQVVMANALRARGDALTPTALHVVSYLIVMIPVAWLLAFPLGRGTAGLIEGIVIASIVSLALLAGRFQLLVRRDRTLGRSA